MRRSNYNIKKRLPPNVDSVELRCFPVSPGSTTQYVFLIRVDGLQHLQIHTGKNKGKGKEIPLQAWRGLEVSSRLSLPYFMTIGT